MVIFLDRILVGAIRQLRKRSTVTSPLAFRNRVQITMSNENIHKALPHFAEGEVVKGFGRGSKELGCPTANYPTEVVNKLPPEIDSGVYFGFANVDDGPVYKMVMSVGWNPYYNNTVKSMETHIIHPFNEDFYGKWMKIVMLGHLRPQKNFNSLDELKKAIKDDIDEAKRLLDEPQYAEFKNHPHFKKRRPN